MFIAYSSSYLGGTINNLYAVMLARQKVFPNVKKEGMRNCEQLVMFQSKHVRQKQSNLHYTRGITPKHVTTGGARLRGLPLGQHSSEKTLQRLRTVGTTNMSDLTGPETNSELPAPITEM